MSTPKRGPRFGGGASHQKHLFANLASDLYRHGRITTTEAKAKALRPYAEKLITKAKRGDLAARRQVLAKLHDRDVVAYLFDEVAPRFAGRDGGYTRILKLAPRKGDNASMALIELVDRGVERGEDVIEESKVGRSRGLFGRRRKRVAETAAPGAFGADIADVLDEEPGFDVEDDEQVAAAIAEVTGEQGPASDSTSADAPDSTTAAGSPEEAPGETDEAADEVAGEPDDEAAGEADATSGEADEDDETKS